MTDRLEEIKHRRIGWFNISPVVASDVDWLIAEVERLRIELASARNELSGARETRDWCDCPCHNETDRCLECCEGRP